MRESTTRMSGNTDAPTRRTAKLSWDDSGTSVDFSPDLGYRPGMVTELHTPPRWVEALHEYTAHVRATTPRSEYNRVYHIRRMSQMYRTQSPWTLETRDLEAYITLYNTHSRQYRRSILSAIRRFYKWGLRERYIRENPAAVLDSIPNEPGRPRPVSDSLIRQLLDECHDDRARMAITIEAYCGLRGFETAKLHTDDLFYDHNGIARIRIKGKGDRQREIPAPPAVLGIFQSTPPGYLFPSQKGEHLNANSLRDILRKQLPPGVTPHMFRHRYATTVFKKSGGNLLAAKELLGHTSVATTEVYTKVPDSLVDAAAFAAGELDY